jgi:hypothetical protein
MPHISTVVVTQSNYIPWRGYFDQMRLADRFVLLDCVQYTRRDWRNRNRIKTPRGFVWLTIPVEVKGRYHQAVDETLVAEPSWAERHWKSIEVNYSRAAAFAQEGPWLAERLKEAGGFKRLSEVNAHLLEAIARRIGIATRIEPSDALLPREALVAMEPTQRLLELCRAVGARRYLSGPAAEAYLDTGVFDQAGIEVVWMDYAGYPDYPQCWGGFEGTVSIIDLLLNFGAGGVLSAFERGKTTAAVPPVA